ncbi:hypothetical protein RIR_jg4391.t2 [Rhizophagus irregularis DAOM 181602=DAOM 197198]|nr:hypothetical protein RIR_jg4391.t2 [Rhizophagus irregularis DAOM 181602=DAOM 197198]
MKKVEHKVSVQYTSGSRKPTNEEFKEFHDDVNLACISQKKNKKKKLKSSGKCSVKADALNKYRKAEQTKEYRNSVSKEVFEQKLNERYDEDGNPASYLVFLALRLNYSMMLKINLNS